MCVDIGLFDNISSGRQYQMSSATSGGMLTALPSYKAQLLYVVFTVCEAVEHDQNLALNSFYKHDWKKHKLIIQTELNGNSGVNGDNIVYYFFYVHMLLWAIYASCSSEKKRISFSSTWILTENISSWSTHPMRLHYCERVRLHMKYEGIISCFESFLK